MDPELLEVLACPCPQHAPVAPDDPTVTTKLVCQRCGTTFPVRDGIPVMLLGEATPGPGGIGS
jgi:hypothetical protein